ncbi:MAG: HlyD family efflux transporter periplasmic adaptor subunit [Planctomycetota bacterium]
MIDRPLRLLVLPSLLVAAGLIGWSTTATAQDVGGFDAASSGDRTFVGITRPSKSFELAFSNVGKVAEVAVRPGDRVEMDQLLMRQDDRLERARLVELRAEADVAGRIATARQRADLAAVQEKRTELARDQGFGNQLELEEARINRVIAELQTDEEIRQGTAADARVDQLEIQIAQKAVNAPSAGIVRTIEAQVGEMHGPQNPTIELVVLDPLKVEILNLPPDRVASLAKGDEVMVRYGRDGSWQRATISFIDPIASAETNEQKVELELPNPELRAAGREVQVKLADE